MTNISEVEGFGVFGAGKVLDHTYIEASNSIVITGGCDSYTDNSLDGNLRIRNITNPTSVFPTDSIVINVTTADNYLIALTCPTCMKYTATSGALEQYSISSTVT